MIIIHDVIQARENIADFIHKTPILHSSQLSEICGNKMYFKAVSEEEIKMAQTFILERMKQLIEPSSAVTVAAAMSRKLGVQGKNVVCVLSGGNVVCVLSGGNVDIGP